MRLPHTKWYNVGTYIITTQHALYWEIIAISWCNDKEEIHFSLWKSFDLLCSREHPRVCEIFIKPTIIPPLFYYLSPLQTFAKSLQKVVTTALITTLCTKFCSLYGYIKTCNQSRKSPSVIHSLCHCPVMTPKDNAGHRGCVKNKH